MICWFVRFKHRCLDYPAGLLLGVILALCVLVAVALAWHASYGVCLPGDDWYCARKAIHSAVASLVGLQVPYDASVVPERFLAVSRPMIAGALLVALAAVLLRTTQSQLNAWLLSFSRNAAGILGSGASAAPVRASLPDAVHWIDNDAVTRAGFRGFRACVASSSAAAQPIRHRLLKRARTLLLLRDNAADNVADLELAFSSTPPRGERSRNAIVRVDRFWHRRQVQDELSRRQSAGFATVQCISRDAQRARRLLREFPTNYRLLCGSQLLPAVYWIVGELDSALEILLQVARQSPSRFFLGLRIELYCPNARRGLAELQHHCPMLASLVDLQAHNTDIEFPQLAEHLVTGANERRCVPGTIYLCLHDSGLGAVWRRQLATAFRARDQLPPLLLSTSEPATGSAEAIGTEDWLDASDQLASSLHAAFQRTVAASSSEAMTRSWDQLPFDLQEENRALADHVSVKLRDLFLCALSGTGPVGAREPDLRVSFAPLAPQEHRRWMLSRAVLGWSYGAKFDPDARQHPAMLSADRLSPLDRDKDAQLLASLGEVLALEGWVVRQRALLVVRCHGRQAAELRQSLRNLLVQHPDALFLVELADAEVTRSLQTVAQGLATVAPVIPAGSPASVLPTGSPWAPENLQFAAQRPWGIVQLVDISLEQLADVVGARYVEL